MKYILTENLGALKKGSIIDSSDKLEVTMLVGDEFYKANPKQFKPIGEENGHYGLEKAAKQ